MNIEEFRIYCLSKIGVTEEFPFDENTLVYKVMGKIFAITGLDNDEFAVNLKCSPEYAIELRERYDSILPGFHMSKKHWNTINVNSLSDDILFRQLIDDSYNLVVAGLKKSQREVLSNLQNQK